MLIHPSVIGLLASALAIAIHHRVIHGYWFDIPDMDCHEIWVVGLITMAVGVLAGSSL